MIGLESIGLEAGVGVSQDGVFCGVSIIDIAIVIAIACTCAIALTLSSFALLLLCYSSYLAAMTCMYVW